MLHTFSIMAYAIFGDSYVERLEDFTRGDLRFKYDCNFYGVSGMATDNKFESAFNQLCSERPRYYLFIYLFIYLVFMRTVYLKNLVRLAVHRSSSFVIYLLILM